MTERQNIVHYQHVGVIGAGAWGTALAQSLASGGDVTLWARREEVAASIRDTRENALFLPGVRLDEKIRATSRLADLAACDMWLLAMPAQHVRAILGQALEHAGGVRPLVSCSKGIEAGTLKLMSEVVEDVAPDAPCAILSGPSFAGEVALGLPTAIVLSCTDTDLGRQLAVRVGSRYLRTYVNDDVIGTEVGGAVKNVLAIACGVVEGARLGANARAALIARGYAEMQRFGVSRGARIETLSGLSGLGDLVLTCTSTQSRNMRLGFGLGEGRTAVDILADRRDVAEGASTAPVLQAAARQIGVEMPIVDTLVDLLAGTCSVRDAVARLLSRPSGRHENDWSARK